MEDSKDYTRFLYSVNDEKFYWYLFVPKHEKKVALSLDDFEWKKVCFSKKEHLDFIEQFDFDL